MRPLLLAKNPFPATAQRPDACHSPATAPYRFLNSSQKLVHRMSLR